MYHHDVACQLDLVKKNVVFSKHRKERRMVSYLARHEGVHGLQLSTGQLDHDVVRHGGADRGLLGGLALLDLGRLGLARELDVPRALELALLEHVEL